MLLADSSYPSSVFTHHHHCNSPSSVSSQCSDLDPNYHHHHVTSSTTCYSPFTVISTPSISGNHTPIKYCSSIPNSPNSVLVQQQQQQSPHHHHRLNAAQQFAEHYPAFVMKLLEWQMNSHDTIHYSEFEQTLLNASSSSRHASQPESPEWNSEPVQRLRKRRRSTHCKKKLERQKSAPLWKTWPSIEKVSSEGEFV